MKHKIFHNKYTNLYKVYVKPYWFLPYSKYDTSFLSEYDAEKFIIKQVAFNKPNLKEIATFVDGIKQCPKENGYIDLQM